VRKGTRPQLRRRTKDVNETAAVTARDLGAIRNTDEIRVTIVTEAAVKFSTGRDYDGE
jgi:hypothetical protein